MPPFKLKIRCRHQDYSNTAYYPKALIWADKHVNETGHIVDVFRLDGTKFQTVAKPERPESW